MKKCEIDWCENSALGRKPYCSMHVQRLRNGSDMHMRPRAARGAGEQFLLSLVGTDKAECIHWPFAKFKDGTGHAHLNGHSIVASRLMCIIAHGEPPFAGAEAAHNCGKGHEACVNPNHLRWATRVENFADKIIHDTHNKGERNINAILTEAEAMEILSLKGRGMSQYKVAAMYGRSRALIGLIWQGKRWGHLSGGTSASTALA